MLDVANGPWLEFLNAPAKITMAARRLEELQCLNTAEVVIMWAWTAGVINPVDHDGWRSIGHDTLRFCRANGMGYPMALKSYIIHSTPKKIRPSSTVVMEVTFINYFVRRMRALPVERGVFKESVGTWFEDQAPGILPVSVYLWFVS